MLKKIAWKLQSTNISLLRIIGTKIQFLLSNRGEVYVESLGYKFYVRKEDIGLGQRLLNEGVYEAFETSLINSLVKPGMNTLNIGANIGYYTVQHSKLVGDTGTVYAFEPESINFDLLMKNLKENKCDNTKAFQSAVGDKNGQMTLYIDCINRGAMSMHPKNIVGDSGKVTVQSITLDDYVEKNIISKKIDLIQMDTQGSEAMIVRGAQNMLTENKPLIIMEFWPFGLYSLDDDPQELLETLEQIGYKYIFSIDENKQELIPVNTINLIEQCVGRPDKKGYTNIILSSTELDLKVN